MTEPAKDFWARADRDLLKRWPKDAEGHPERAVRLGIQWELDSMADITVFKNGTLGKVLGGFAAQGVDICVPASRAEEARALLEQQPETAETAE